MSTVKKIAKLLEDPRIERRCAAAMVLGELGEKAAVPALCACLSDGTPLLQRYVLEAVEALGASSQAAKHLVPLLESADVEVRARAAAMLAGSGAHAAAALRREFDPQVGVARRRAVVQVLAQHRSTAALDALLETFGDPEIAEFGLNALRSELDRMPAKERKQVVDRAEAMLSHERKAPSAAAHALRLLGYLGDPSSIRHLLVYAGERHQPAIRAAALASLRRPLAHIHGKKRDEVAQKLIPFLDDEDAAVAREALGTLQSIPLPAAATKELLKLSASSRHAETRRFAVERVGRADVGAREAAALVAKLEAPDAAVRDAAARSLSRLEAAAVPLVKALVTAESSERVRRLADILRAQKIKLAPALRESLAARAMDLLDEGDALAEPMLEVLRVADPGLYVERLVGRAEKLRKQKKHLLAWALLRPMIRSGIPLPDDARYLAAVCGLKASGKDLLRAARTTDPALSQLLALLNRGFPLLQRLRKEGDLLPDDLFYVGFNFVESLDPDEKDFGAELLEHLVDKLPRTKLGRSARNKLKLAGWVEE